MRQIFFEGRSARAFQLDILTLSFLTMLLMLTAKLVLALLMV